ncbi:MAG: rhodanese-like domain-containing protein [Flavitalea sp.]
MENISVQEVSTRLQSGEKLHLVDVREPDENADFNIGGILLPLGAIYSMQLESIEDFKESEVIVYCRSGNRSLQAALFLETAGFKNVKNLAGGMNEWKSIVLL